MHLSFFDSVVFIAFLISLTVFIHKPVPLYLKLFPVYFLGALLSGLYSEWLVAHNHFNIGIANRWGIIEFCFYFFVIHEIVINIKVRRVILLVLIFFALFAFSNLIFIQKKVGFNNVNYSVGCIITVIFSIYYFIELFQKAQVQSLARSPAFWIATAIMFNTVISFPIFSMQVFMETMDKTNLQKYQLIEKNMEMIGDIILILSVILYSIGFLCRITIRKSTL
jgi:hypothetical protein